MYKHNYQEWLDGKIVLDTCPYELKNGENVSVCKWDDFKLSDREKLKESQKIFFENSSKELLDKWKNEFNKRFSNSCDPELFLQDEIYFFEYVIFYDKNLILVDSYNFLRLEHKGKSLFFENLDFWSIRNFIDYNIVGGNEINYDFVNSENFKLKKKDHSNEVYGKALWDYYKWLKVKTETKDKSDQKKLTENFKDNLIKYGFLELPLVSKLNEVNQKKLLENLSLTKIPYCVAMFYFLKFFDHLKVNHFKIYGHMYDEVYLWFFPEKRNKLKKSTTPGYLGTDIRKNLASLTRAVEARYTAHLHKEEVALDYIKLENDYKI